MNFNADPPSELSSTDGVPRPRQLHPMSRSETWLEVCAVLAVGVVPHLANAILSIGGPPYSPLPFLSDAFYLIVLSACNAYVVVYLISRSGERWARFGIVPPSTSDVSIGAALFVAALACWTLVERILVALGLEWTDYEFATASTPMEWALLFPMLLANSIAEEVVTRAYLVTRFEELLSSKWAAAFFSTALFASYHCYQGAVGVLCAAMGGAMLAATFLRFRRLWPLVWAHTFFNLYCYSPFNS